MRCLVMFITAVWLLFLLKVLFLVLVYVFNFDLFELLAAILEKGLLGNLSKPRRQQQRERHQTKGLRSRTIAVHVRYKSLYISLLSPAKQQCEITKFCVAYGAWTTAANFSYLEFNAVVA